MLFAIKIIRFVVGLFVKALLLPFKLVARIVGGGDSGDSGDDYDFDIDDPGATATEAGTGTESTAGTGAESTARTPDADARQRIGWFRKGLFAVGVIQLLLGLGTMIGMSGLAMRAGGPAIVGGIIVAVVLLSAIPLGIGALLPRYPTGAWYAGMGFLVLSALISIAGGLAGVVWAAVYGAVAYCGYEGRPALATVYGDETPSTGASRPTDPTASATGSPTASAESNGDTPGGAAPDRTSAATGAGGSTTPGPSDGTAADRGGADRANEQSGGAAAPAAPAAATGGETPQGDAASPTPEPDGDATVETEAAAAAGDAGSATASDEAAAESAAEAAADAESLDGSSDAGDGVVSTYRDDLADADPDVREAAVRDLADAVDDDAVPDQAAIDALADRLDDDDPAVRVAACDALGRVGAAEVTSQLRELRIDPDTDVSRAASRALRDLE